MNDETAKIARRLSGALGRKIAPDDIELERDGTVVLTDGTCCSLARGNTAYIGAGVWMRNGVELTDDEANRIEC